MVVGDVQGEGQGFVVQGQLFVIEIVFDPYGQDGAGLSDVELGGVGSVGGESPGASVGDVGVGGHDVGDQLVGRGVLGD